MSSHIKSRYRWHLIQIIASLIMTVLVAKQVLIFVLLHHRSDATFQVQHKPLHDCLPVFSLSAELINKHLNAYTFYFTFNTCSRGCH